QQVTGQTFRRFIFLDVDLAGARGDAPVDGADRVAPLVGPRLHELDARPQEGRAVRAVTQAVREPLDGNQELSCVQRIAGLQVTFHEELSAKAVTPSSCRPAPRRGRVESPGAPPRWSGRPPGLRSSGASGAASRPPPARTGHRESRNPGRESRPAPAPP